MRYIYLFVRIDICKKPNIGQQRYKTLRHIRTHCRQKESAKWWRYWTRKITLRESRPSTYLERYGHQRCQLLLELLELQILRCNFLKKGTCGGKKTQHSVNLVIKWRRVWLGLHQTKRMNTYISFQIYENIKGWKNKPCPLSKIIPNSVRVGRHNFEHPMPWDTRDY